MIKTSELLDLMYKVASLKDLNCEECGYQGQPDYDGRCPDCGALCGIKPKSTNYISQHNDYSRNMAANQLYDALSKAQQENQAIHTMI